MTTDIPTEELLFPMPWGHVSAKAWGSPKDKRVLVVHGILDNAGSFDTLIPLLPHGYYYVCIDLPGHGLSSHFPAGISLDHFQYVLVIRKVLDSLKWDRCIYMGHSYGALLGWIHSTLHPETIEKFISFDIECPLPVSNDQLISTLRSTYDYVMKLDSYSEAASPLYTKQEAMHMFTHSRFYTFNTAAAEAMMKRCVAKVGDKYKFTYDPRLKSGVLPFLNNEQHRVILKQLETPILTIMSSETSGIANDTPQTAKIDHKNRRNRYVIVEGDHNVHANYPERVAPHVHQLLGSPKSTL